jgi:hypothetical protein
LTRLGLDVLAKARLTLVRDSTAATEEAPINHIPALSA